VRKYSNQKRKFHDYCNIGGILADLTWDHVPPKSCLNDMPVRFNHFLDGVPRYNQYSKISQNGIRFRTICAHCNNELLGRIYDPALCDFTKNVVAYITETLNTARTVEDRLIAIPNRYFDVQINKMVRSICGHILAAKNEYQMEGTLENSL